MTRPRRYVTRATLGTAAEKILNGEVDATQLDGLIAACAWCQFDRSNYECWHYAAQVLIEQGLRPREDRTPFRWRVALEPWQLQIDEAVA